MTNHDDINAPSGPVDNPPGDEHGAGSDSGDPGTGPTARSGGRTQAKSKEYKPKRGDFVRLGAMVPRERRQDDQIVVVREHTADPKELDRNGVAPQYGLVVDDDPVSIVLLPAPVRYDLPVSKAY